MLCGVDLVLKTSLSAEAKDFLYVDGLNWARTLSTISAMSLLAAFAGDYFGDKPKTVADSDDTREACCPSNLSWFLVIGLMLSAVTLMMFLTSMQNLDPSVFADANENPDADADFDADADTDVDPYLDADADFELIFLEAISMF
uniref:Uncharacterized protein n=1 Tax=Solanum tuberosum TaxID=4113 RepID=M1DSJ8_SOLTU